uniref:NR LBD domain-containing protein n=1 Tax=Plectus sambesii TaxID=2011161 RepID=A0A914VDR9_9BILA
MNFNEVATMKNYLTIVESEPKFVANYLNSSGVFLGLTASDTMAVFKNYIITARLAEQAYFVALHGERFNDRFVLLDGSFVIVSQTELTRFYGSGKTSAGQPVLMDPSFLARMSLPSATFHVKELIPGFQQLRLSDQEFAALLNLILWDTEANNNCLDTEI